MVAPIAALAATPVPNAVALVDAKAAVGDLVMPKGAVRWAVRFDGTETSAEIANALTLEPVMALIECARLVCTRPDGCSPSSPSKGTKRP